MGEEKNTVQDYKTIECIIDNFDMFYFIKNFIRKKEKEYVCDGRYIKSAEDETIPVKFYISNTYEIFALIGSSWGGWNQCPSWNVMEQKQKNGMSAMALNWFKSHMIC